jgi:TIR domain-containing protein
MTSSSSNASDFALARRWILVAGTGLEDGTPETDRLVAKAVGVELAKHRYGLVVGGWPGVDYLVTESFLNELSSHSLDPRDYLIQVLSNNRPLLLHQGHVIRTPYGGREWLEPQKYADAVILIGGRGGTFDTWLGALHDGMPRFPVGGTHGDAESAFKKTFDLWELIPVPGITRPEFDKLRREISSEADAKAVAQCLVEELLWRSLNAVDALSRGNGDSQTSIFISYSRKDSDWVARLRTLLRPAERQGIISTWMDADIRAGKPWERELLAHLESTQATLVLVSSNLLKSSYVRDVEMPAFMKKKINDPRFHLFWVLLEDCDWRSLPDLETFQAIGNVEIPVNKSLTEADQQCRLIEIVNTMTRALRDQGRKALEQSSPVI